MTQCNIDLKQAVIEGMALEKAFAESYPALSTEKAPKFTDTHSLINSVANSDLSCEDKLDQVFKMTQSLQKAILTDAIRPDKLKAASLEDTVTEEATHQLNSSPLKP